MTGHPVEGAGDAIWDDGEWISWNYINEQLEGPYPQGDMLEDLIVLARTYLAETGRHLSVYRALGELYAERRFGIDLHRDPQGEGSDGWLGNQRVEIKTIAPRRDTRHVSVRESGTFGLLVIVKIEPDFRIDAKLIPRKSLPKPKGGRYSVCWDAYPDQLIEGEDIGWDYINEEMDDPCSGGHLVQRLIGLGKTYLEDEGRHLPIYGALGELYVARRFGIDLHQDPHREGSDGRIGNQLVEVKTITPRRNTRQVRVRRSGNFGILAIVKIDGDFRIDAKLIRRKRLPKRDGTHYTVNWDDHRSEHGEIVGC